MGGESMFGVDSSEAEAPLTIEDVVRRAECRIIAVMGGDYMTEAEVAEVAEGIRARIDSGALEDTFPELGLGYVWPSSAEAGSYANDAALLGGHTAQESYDVILDTGDQT